MSLVITTSINIAATNEQVWHVLTDFKSYGQWSNFSRVDGTAEEGTRLAMRMPGMSFKSTVTAATPGSKLQWSAKILSERLFLGQHSFTLSTNSDGTTLLTNTETFSGALVWPFQGLFAGSKKANGYDAFNQALKKQVESARLTA